MIPNFVHRSASSLIPLLVVALTGGCAIAGESQRRVRDFLGEHANKVSLPPHA